MLAQSDLLCKDITAHVFRQSWQLSAAAPFLMQEKRLFDLTDASSVDASPLIQEGINCLAQNARKPL
jgi:hypothetical protein